MKIVIRANTSDYRDPVVINSAQEWQDVVDSHIFSFDDRINAVFTDQAIDDIIDCIVDDVEQYSEIDFESSTSGLPGRMDTFFYYLKHAVDSKSLNKVKGQFKQRCPFYYCNIDTKYLPEAKRTFAEIYLRLITMLTQEFPGTNVDVEYGKSYTKLHYKGRKKPEVTDAILDQLDSDPDVFQIEHHPTSSYYCFNVVCRW